LIEMATGEVVDVHAVLPPSPEASETPAPATPSPAEPAGADMVVKAARTAAEAYRTGRPMASYIGAIENALGIVPEHLKPAPASSPGSSATEGAVLADKLRRFIDNAKRGVNGLSAGTIAELEMMLPAPPPPVLTITELTREDDWVFAWSSYGAERDSNRDVQVPEDCRMAGRLSACRTYLILAGSEGPFVCLKDDWPRVQELVTKVNAEAKA
jgi:hypothetical protein